MKNFVISYFTNLHVIKIIIIIIHVLLLLTAAFEAIFLFSFFKEGNHKEMIFNWEYICWSLLLFGLPIIITFCGDRLTNMKRLKNEYPNFTDSANDSNILFKILYITAGLIAFMILLWPIFLLVALCFVLVYSNY
jgi:hypothetical protein